MTSSVKNVFTIKIFSMISNVRNAKQTKFMYILFAGNSLAIGGFIENNCSVY